MGNVQWTEAALTDLKRLDRVIVRRILRKITWVAGHFDELVPEPLGGEFKGAYKLRVGDWRVIYTLDRGSLLIHLVRHRKEVYKVR